MKNHYETLELSPPVTIDQVRKAYRRCAVKYHPDKHFGSDEYVQKFILIKEAYDILGDENKKSEYDAQFQKYFGNGRSEQTKTESESKQTERKKEEEKFRYDPFKPFFSPFDREVQESPQFAPKIDHWNSPLPQDSDFFVLPKRIGKIVSGFTTLKKGEIPLQGRALFLKIMKGASIGMLIGLGIILLASVQSAPWLLAWLVVPGMIGGWFSSLLSKFSHYNSFVGVNGFAEYECKGTRDNITKSKEINFNDVTDLASGRIVNKRNFQYSHTSFAFVWMNTEKKEVLYEIDSLYNDKNDNPPKDISKEYWINSVAEKYWTIYLMDKMESILESQGYLKFNFYSFKDNKFMEYIRVGVGFITFIKPEGNFTYKFNEIKKMYVKGGDLFIEHYNYEKKWFFMKSGNQDFIPLTSICNRQFLIRALEIFLGFKFN